MGRVLIMSLFLAACSFGEGNLEEVDPEAAPANPTWSLHIQPIMHARCTACHSPDAQPGKVEGYSFATCKKLKKYRKDYRESVEEEKTMPPGGSPRLESWEILTVQRWFDQGATCD